MDLAMGILVTGLVVVFAVLTILIFVIKLYSAIINFFQNKVLKKKSHQPEQPKSVKSVAKNEGTGNTISAEVVAAIVAAVAYLEGDDVKICKIEKSTSNSNGVAWGLMAQMELTRPF